MVINEVAWMGTEKSHYDEWIELKNRSDKKVDINNWQLKSGDGSPEIVLSGEIEPNGFLLLERTDDDSSPAKADLIYKGSLSNKGEVLLLLDKNGNKVDEVKAGSGWPAGDNTTKRTMERIENGWQTSSKKGGTPGQENSTPPKIQASSAKKAEILPVQAWRRPADKRFLKTLFGGLTVSLVSTTSTLLLKRYLTRLMNLA